MSSAFSFRPGSDPLGTLFETVSSLTERIKDTLEADFADVAVHGEITNLARPKSGHVYFSLRDQTASLRAVMWKSDAQRLAFDLSDGLAVRMLGRLTVYPPRGEYQVVVRHLEPEGIGALELAFRQLHARLSAEGLFDPERKRPMPRFPRRIVIVTSPTGAAVRDLLQVTGRRWAAADILIAPARVQGAGAGAEIAAAIALANRVTGCRPDHHRAGRRVGRRPLGVQRRDRGAGDRRLTPAGHLGRRPRDRCHAGRPGRRPSAP